MIEEPAIIAKLPSQLVELSVTLLLKTRVVI